MSIGAATSLLIGQGLHNYHSTGYYFAGQWLQPGRGGWIWPNPYGRFSLAVGEVGGNLGFNIFLLNVSEWDPASLQAEQPEVITHSPRWLADALPALVPPHGFEHASYLHCSGLPARCVWLRYDVPHDGSPVLAQSQLVIGDVTLATGILWPGLIADTLFYGTLWYGLLLAPGMIRRARRRRRGLCPRCGYSLAGLPPERSCPECGTARSPVRPPRVTASQA